MIDDGQRLLRRAHAPARHAQALEGLRARHLMDEMAVDVDATRAARRLDDVVVPDILSYNVRGMDITVSSARRRE